jgi:5-methyltetrahydrofolate--homocysteine methyltransferase
MHAYKEDIEISKERVEAWWHHEIIDRAVIQVTAPPYRVPESSDRDEFEISGDETNAIRRSFYDPEAVIPQLKKRISKTFFGGEAFPVMFPVSTRMVAILGNYLGCPIRFNDIETTWSEHIFENWDKRPTFHCDLNNPLWQISKMLLTTAVEQSDGFFVGIPDLNGPTEILSRLRSPQRLALDFYDHPEHIKPALAEINLAWYGYWQECTRITERLGGYFYWMGIWSNLPSIDLQSDFSTMISKEMFDEYFLPFIEEQTWMVPRTIYHLDGPGAITHLDSLLGLPNLNGIQWIPGAGARPTVEWIPLLKKIQEAGKLVYVYCAKDNVKQLLDGLNPEGLMLVTSCNTEGEVQRLIENVYEWT